MSAKIRNAFGSNRLTNQTCVYGSMAGLAPTTNVRPNVTGLHGYKSSRSAANMFIWPTNAPLYSDERSNGCGLGKHGQAACRDGKKCVDYIGFTQRVVQYYPGKRMLS